VTAAGVIEMRTSEFLVKIHPEGLYGAVLDRTSPANFSRFIETEFDRTRKLLNRGEEAALLFLFNSLLDERGRAGELLAWAVLLDGVYKAEIAEQGNPLPHVFASADLDFPTGEVLVTCLSRLGDADLLPALTVAPGKYRTTFSVDHAEETKHEGLEREADYPPGDGPDWRLTLQRIA
jgi:hypothetical protein